VMIGKPLAALVVAQLLKQPLRVGLAISVALAQIGEFSFILANLASSLKIIPAEAMNALVVTSVISITLNPLLYRAIDPAVDWLEARKIVRPPDFVPPAPGAFQKDPTRDLVVVVGYGPVGRTVSRILLNNNVQPRILELNIDTILQLNAEGLQAVYGDASKAEILRAAKIEEAVALIISTSAPETATIIAAARELNPRIRVLTRSTYLVESEALRKAGADAIFSSEGEVALSMADFLMEQLGATDEQIDRERDRVRKDLFRS
jgi:monovalent cation:H+ antiporter-2, CPA2 family